MKIYIYFFLFVFITSCSGSTQKKEQETNPADPSQEQLNISILLDLSDRIDPSNTRANPNQAKRDIESILSVVDVFKANMEAKGAFQSKDKMRVLFHPQPKIDDLSELVDEFSVNLEGLTPPEKKGIYDNIANRYKKNLDKLYKVATSQDQFEGADIWHFMKDDVRNKAIADSSNYRNILIILTDGYMYWPFDKQKRGNKYNYITGRYSHFNRFRETSLLETEFAEEDYGFIPVQEDLSNMEVLVIGVNPPKNYPQDYEIIKRFWSKWFEEMNVSRYGIFKTDIPTYTREEIKEFIAEI